MANYNFEHIMNKVFLEEGGYVNNPKDPGGATKYGITIAVLSAYRGKKCTPTDVKNLTPAEAMLIYKKNYWSVIKGDDLPSGIDYVVMDFAVNSGTNRAARYLQALVGAGVDGVIGNETIGKVKKFAPDSLIDKYMDQRLAFLRGLSTWSTFGKGWSARVSRVRAYAHELVRAPAPTDNHVEMENVDHTDTCNKVETKLVKDPGRASVKELYDTVVEEIAQTAVESIAEDAKKE